MYDALRKFIINDLIRDPSYDLKNDEPLISGGLIDSFSLVELQLFIEQEYGIHIEDTELTAESIDKVDDLIALINARK